MFSNDCYVCCDNIGTHQDELNARLRDLQRTYDLQAVLLCAVDVAGRRYEVIAGLEIPIEPFNGNEQGYLTAVLTACFERFHKPHVHSIKEFAMSAIVKRFNAHLQGTNRIWFAPLSVNKSCFIFIGFPRPESTVKSLPDTLIPSLVQIIKLSDTERRLKLAEARLATTELCAKEIGHDIAGSVQAVLAKAHSITQRRVEGDAVYRRVKEIGYEIMAIHRHAESLGIASDQNYQIREWDDFDGADVVNRIIDPFASEAEEKHIRIDNITTIRSIELFGDSSAVSHALGQMLLNAIKYSFGGSTIYVGVADEGDFARFEVKNLGIPLPQDDRERNRLWEFGERSAQAKELHVNGSGIGLYTARKIILKHEGTVFADSKPNGNSRAAVRFGFLLPTKRSLRRIHGESFFLERKNYNNAAE